MLFEQYLNAAHIRVLGFGDYSTADRPGAGIVRAFESRLDQFRANLAGQNFDGTERVVDRLRSLLRR
jgi:hypothetical protein